MVVAKGYKNIGVREPLADEVSRVLKKEPWLGQPYLGNLVDRLLQDWLEKAYALIREREAYLQQHDEGPRESGEDFDPRR